MKSRWTFRCYPTPDQEQCLARTFGCVRFVWNWALRLRSDGFRNGERIGYPETDKRLTLLKREPETVWLNEVSSVCLQQSLRDLQVAYSNFFDKRTSYPKFKRKDGPQSANYTERGFSGLRIFQWTARLKNRVPTKSPSDSSVDRRCYVPVCNISRHS